MQASNAITNYIKFFNNTALFYRKGKDKYLLQENRQYHPQQKAYIGRRRKGNYMTPLGGTVRLLTPSLLAGGFSGTLGYAGGKMMGLKGAKLAGVTGLSAASSAVPIGVLAYSEHRRTPQSVFYKRKR